MGLILTLRPYFWAFLYCFVRFSRLCYAPYLIFCAFHTHVYRGSGRFCPILCGSGAFVLPDYIFLIDFIIAFCPRVLSGWWAFLSHFVRFLALLVSPGLLPCVIFFLWVSYSRFVRVMGVFVLFCRFSRFFVCDAPCLILWCVSHTRFIGIRGVFLSHFVRLLALFALPGYIPLFS